MKIIVAHDANNGSIKMAQLIMEGETVPAFCFVLPGFNPINSSYPLSFTHIAQSEEAAGVLLFNAICKGAGLTKF